MSKMNAMPDQMRTAMVPVMTVEEIVVPTEAEQQAMRQSLEAATAEIAAGHFAVHDPEGFVDGLMAIRRKSRRSRTA